MSWDKKKRGRSTGYFYQSVRTPGIPGFRKLYFGCGAAAAEAAERLAQTQRIRQQARDARRQEETAFQTEHENLRGLQRQTTQALVLWLEANGYHRHHGEWRRRREHS